WAHYASSTVPDLDAAFDGRGISSDARLQLKRLRYAADVFRFKLFDRQGRQLLVSDELDQAGMGMPVALPAGAVQPAPPASHAAPAAALAGNNHIVLKRESRTDRPPV